jgi:hypothetical protein
MHHGRIGALKHRPYAHGLWQNRKVASRVAPAVYCGTLRTTTATSRIS